jgi:hypothetical protein
MPSYPQCCHTNLVLPSHQTGVDWKPSAWYSYPQSWFQIQSWDKVLLSISRNREINLKLIITELLKMKETYEQNTNMKENQNTHLHYAFQDKD